MGGSSSSEQTVEQNETTKITTDNSVNDSYNQTLTIGSLYKNTYIFNGMGNEQDMARLVQLANAYSNKAIAESKDKNDEEKKGIYKQYLRQFHHEGKMLEFSNDSMDKMFLAINKGEKWGLEDGVFREVRGELRQEKRNRQNPNATEEKLAQVMTCVRVLMDENVKNLSTQVQTTDSRIQTLSSELSNLQKHHQDLETQKANKAENEVAQLTNTQTTVQQKIESVNGELTQVQGTKQNLDTQLVAEVRKHLDK
jgi:vacuolar-type H+-ATPase subunit I/STV1